MLNNIEYLILGYLVGILFMYIPWQLQARREARRCRLLCEVIPTLTDYLENGVPKLLNDYQMEDHHAVAEISTCYQCPEMIAKSFLRGAIRKFPGLQIYETGYLRKSRRPSAATGLAEGPEV